MSDLIFGKNKTERIVNVEAVGSSLILFIQEEDGTITENPIPNKYWLITSKSVSSKQKTLKGNQYYRYLAEFDDFEEKEKARKVCRKNNVDLYHIYDPKESSMVRQGITYFKGMKPKEVSILSFDIETTGLVHDERSFVVMISNTFRDHKGKITRKLFSYDEFENQAEMIDSWCTWVRNMNPSLIVNHNIFGFDLPYLNFVAEMNNTSLYLGRDGSKVRFQPFESSFRIDGSKDLEYTNCYIYGRDIIDTMFLSYKHDIVEKKYESYGLKTITKQEGLEKPNRVFYDASLIRNNYRNPEELKKIKAYGADDADDALALFDLMIPAQFYFAQSISKTMQQIVNGATGSQINNLIVRSYLQDDCSIAKASELTEHVEGGISFAVPGIYKNLYKLDIKSCYPSQILRFKLFDDQKDPKGNFYEMVNYFTMQRFELKQKFKETKDNYYKDRDASSKIFINSSYGMLNAPGLNYNSPKIAAKITAESRKIIDESLRWASGKGKDFWMEKFEAAVGKTSTSAE